MSINFDFKGKRVLVTGGTKGLGRAIVEKFLASGAKVFAVGRDVQNLKELQTSLSDPLCLTIIQTDLSNWEESRKIVAKYGPYHHLVNNAGILFSAPFPEMTSEAIDKIFGINFKSYINMGQVMANGLKDNGINGGTIVNVSSVADDLVVPGIGAYSCTKSAITMLTKVMALELAPQGIRVNVVRPSLMATEIVPTESEEDKSWGTAIFNYCMKRQVDKRLVTVEEAADAVLYLSSDGSNMINGTSLLIDGGLYTN